MAWTKAALMHCYTRCIYRHVALGWTTGQRPQLTNLKIPSKCQCFLSLRQQKQTDGFGRSMNLACTSSLYYGNQPQVPSSAMCRAYRHVSNQRTSRQLSSAVSNKFSCLKWRTTVPPCHYQLRTLCSHVAKDERKLTFKGDLTDRAVTMLGNQDGHLSVEKWREMRQTFLTTQSNPRFEHFAMYYASHLQYYEMALSFFEFMLAENKTIPENIIGMYLHTCVDNNEIDHVLKWYDMWCERELEIKPSLYGILIKAMCESPKHWIRSLDLLKKHPTSKTYHNVIVAASHNGDTELAAKLLDEMHHGNFEIFDMTVMELLKVVQVDTACYVPGSLKEGVHGAVVKMFERHRRQRSFLPLEVIEVLQHYYRRPYGSDGETWHTRLTYIRRDGTCDACNGKLEPLEISLQEFEELRRQLLEKVIKGADIYRQTTPEELDAFLQFVDEGAPYDIIIDGLNIALNSKVRYKMLYDMVAYLVKDRGLKCLVLGRQHMTKMRGQSGHDVRKTMDLADCFFTQNVSEDDPFMLYATLKSGPDARYITSDLLRDHKFLLGDDMKVAFERWQRSRQMKPKLTSFNRGRMGFEAIRPYDTVVQRSKQGWHIPYDDGTLKYSYDLPKMWLCATRLY